MRHRKLELWDRNDPRRQELIDRRCKTADEVAAWVKEVDERKGGRSGRGGPGNKRLSTKSTESTPRVAELAANAALTLIAVACALLDRQIEAQASAFEKEGGFTERLHRIRSGRR